MTLAQLAGIWAACLAAILLAILPGCAQLEAAADALPIPRRISATLYTLHLEPQPARVVMPGERIPPPMLTAAQVRLVDRPLATPLVWQWITLRPWEDEVTRQPTDHLAGFQTRAAAEAYGRLMGWME